LEQVKELHTSIAKLFDILSTVNNPNPETEKLKSSFEKIKEDAINTLGEKKN